MKIINNGGKCYMNKAFCNLQHFDPKQTIVIRIKSFKRFIFDFNCVYNS